MPRPISTFPAANEPSSAHDAPTRDALSANGFGDRGDCFLPPWRLAGLFHLFTERNLHDGSWVLVSRTSVLLLGSPAGNRCRTRSALDEHLGLRSLSRREAQSPRECVALESPRLPSSSSPYLAKTTCGRAVCSVSVRTNRARAALSRRPRRHHQQAEVYEKAIYDPETADTRRCFPSSLYS